MRAENYEGQRWKIRLVVQKQEHMRFCESTMKDREREGETKTRDREKERDRLREKERATKFPMF